MKIMTGPGRNTVWEYLGSEETKTENEHYACNNRKSLLSCYNLKMFKQIMKLSHNSARIFI